MEGKQQTIDQSRPGIPSLNVTTKFSPVKRSAPHQRNISIQERRKQKQKDIDPISALSQSDGTLIIGFLQPDLPGRHNAEHNVNKSSPPEIVITPAANLENPWKARRRRQPRSSVYSQATRISQFGVTTDRNAPPMPSIPSQGSSQDMPRPLSAVSWHTDFSQDDDEVDELRRRYSGESQLGITRNMSMNTTRERSEGWWNTIVSPIFGRSDTIANRNRPPMPTTHITDKQLGLSKRELTADEGKRN